ncbi:NB-ARC domains-containing protein [Artemisia annua]|uniref:NB-ARC domains-containing protein n=1 Tax=Artemisia annua TaxID=35608 RepID=A0A2U1KEQ3_ARTAN|nr:NB-ARC domains-containing protein [Artemisia annua]
MFREATCDYVRSKKIEFLPDSICWLKSLKYIHFEDCALLPLDEKLCISELRFDVICRLGKLSDIGQFEFLRKLDLSATRIKHLPDSICMLKHLNYLELDGCAFLEKLPEDLGHLECLKELDITHTSISHLPQSIFGLKGLFITASPELLQMYDFPSR